MEIGARFGRYEIRAPLGTGGMGEVMLAFDTMLQRLVALKIVRSDKNRPEAVTRLFSEARAAAALKHPNAVTLLDAGEIDGVPFLAMEYVDGQTLRAYVGASGPVALKLEWLKQLAGVLAAAHVAHIVHRDVKPDNVIVAKDDGQIRVLDFGIAKRIVAVDTNAPTSDGPMSVRTAEGRVVGTTAYMAPEQRAGGAPSPLWDQWAWGVTAYELLSGLRPTTGDVALLHTFLREVPVEVSLTIARALSVEPGQRHADMTEVARALGMTTGALAMPEPNAAAKNVATTAPLHATPPQTSAPEPRRSPMPIVAAAAFVVGATAVFFATRRQSQNATTVTPSASAPSASSSALNVQNTPIPSASSTPVIASIPSSSSAHVAAAPFALGCLCRSVAQNTSSLCARDKLGPSQCRCTNQFGGVLCKTPWTNDAAPTCADDIYGKTLTAKDGDPCQGYGGDTGHKGELTNTHYDGTLARCMACTAGDTFFMAEGALCSAYRDDRTPAEGVVDCDNLRIDCRGGNMRACADVPRHERK
jgi:serine/threonine protein kinase